jgi:hypothetical protein
MCVCVYALYRCITTTHTGTDIIKFHPLITYIHQSITNTRAHTQYRDTQHRHTHRDAQHKDTHIHTQQCSDPHMRCCIGYYSQPFTIPHESLPDIEILRHPARGCLLVRCIYWRRRMHTHICAWIVFPRSFQYSSNGSDVEAMLEAPMAIKRKYGFPLEYNWRTPRVVLKNSMPVVWYATRDTVFTIPYSVRWPQVYILAHQPRKLRIFHAQIDGYHHGRSHAKIQYVRAASCVCSMRVRLNICAMVPIYVNAGLSASRYGWGRQSGELGYPFTIHMNF